MKEENEIEEVAKTIIEKSQEIDDDTLVYKFRQLNRIAGEQIVLNKIDQKLFEDIAVMENEIKRRLLIRKPDPMLDIATDETKRKEFYKVLASKRLN